MPNPVLFIDDGGVMNDNAIRGPHYQRVVGDFLAPILGGAPERWAEANRIVSMRLWAELPLGDADCVDAEFDAFVRSFTLAWLRGMCDDVGVPAPGEEETLAVSLRADRYVCPRINAAYPGAADAIRALHARGHTLHTASGEMSVELEGYVTGMGVRHCFGRFYGADLVKALKTGPTFYERIFADAGVNPVDALVIDDKPLVLAWASQLGARTAVVGSTPGDVEPDLRIASLAELPAALDSLPER